MKWRIEDPRTGGVLLWAAMKKRTPALFGHLVAWRQTEASLEFVWIDKDGNHWLGADAFIGMPGSHEYERVIVPHFGPMAPDYLPESPPGMTAIIGANLSRRQWLENPERMTRRHRHTA